jgi:hypothetical protein
VLQLKFHLNWKICVFILYLLAPVEEGSFEGPWCRPRVPSRSRDSFEHRRRHHTTAERKREAIGMAQLSLRTMQPVAVKKPLGSRRLRAPK